VRLESTRNPENGTPAQAIVLPGWRLRNIAPSWYGDLFLVLFVVVQMLDGWFTYFGVQRFGQVIEANPLLYHLMGLMGEGPALAAAKGFAVACGAFLHLACVHHAVALLTALYLAAAVGPWIGLLFFWF
jgi:hypothetical protein